MRDHLFLVQISILASLLAFGSSAIQPSESKLTTKLTPVNSPSYEDNAKDLTASASDRIFHTSKDYGQSGIYPGGGPYLGLGGTVYAPGTTYRGTGINSGYLNPGYRGYPVGGTGGVIGGGQTGYSYYGSGYNPVYGGTGYGYGGYNGGYGGYNGYGTGLGGYSGYGGYGGYGSGIYDDGYSGYGGRGSYGRYGGLDGYGYTTGYSGQYGPNYASSYNTRSNYDPYVYRNTNYGNYAGYPSGYRGYS